MASTRQYNSKVTTVGDFLPLPKYHRVYLVLKERLHEGLYDQRLPGELELMGEFAVSRVTIRKALSNLAAEGLIVRTAGRGTRRAEQAEPAGTAQRNDSRVGALAAGRRPGLLNNLVTVSRGTTLEVIEYGQMPATEPVAAAMALAHAAPVLRVVRVRSSREGPVSHITTWVPADLSRGLTQRQLARRPILELLEDAGVAVARATQTVSARQADGTVARLLEVPVGAALLSVSRVVFDIHGRPVQLLHGLYRPDRYEYEMQLERSTEIDAKIWITEELGPRIG